MYWQAWYRVQSAICAQTTHGYEQAICKSVGIGEPCSYGTHMRWSGSNVVPCARPRECHRANSRRIDWHRHSHQHFSTFSGTVIPLQPRNRRTVGMRCETTTSLDKNDKYVLATWHRVQCATHSRTAHVPEKASYPTAGVGDECGYQTEMWLSWVGSGPTRDSR